MDERTESGVTVVACGVILVVLFLLFGGGGFFYFVMRQRATEVRMARMAEAQSRENMQKAMAAEELVKASQAALSRASTPSEDDSINVSIGALLRAQEQAWNTGDIDEFMSHYWKSEDLTFSSSGKTTRGWTGTLDRYRERYSTPEQMGKLKLDSLEITTLSDTAALVLGQWRVAREAEPLSGNFSLVVRKFGDRWLIVHDHTSREE